jgi:hypothetical protein
MKANGGVQLHTFLTLEISDQPHTWWKNPKHQLHKKLGKLHMLV